MRKWSPWQQTDAVELAKGRVVPGKTDFPCEYAGRVFLFDNEDNQKAFCDYPRRFLTQLPQIPKSFNIALLGARMSGKRSIAAKLSELYGL